jgi:hypothetical protein
MLPLEAASRLAGLLGLPRAPPTSRRRSVATSTVLVWDDRLTVKVPHADPVAVTSCLTHARVVPVARAQGVRVPEVLKTAIHRVHLSGDPEAATARALREAALLLDPVR